jgi:hypothetical protein
MASVPMERFASLRRASMSSLHLVTTTGYQGEWEGGWEGGREGGREGGKIK